MRLATNISQPWSSGITKEPQDRLYRLLIDDSMASPKSKTPTLTLDDLADMSEDERAEYDERSHPPPPNGEFHLTHC